MLIEGRQKRGAEEPQTLAQTRTVEEARKLIAKGADPYEYIGNGQVALDEMVKWYPIKEFLVEASLEIPDRISWLIKSANFNTVASDKTEWVVPLEYLDDNDIHTASGDIPLSMEIVGILIFHGFIPVFDVTMAEAEVALEHLFFRRYDVDTLSFWLDKRFANHPWRFLDYWVYRTYAGHIAMAEKSPASLALLLFAPHLIYKNSKRAITTMSQFRTADSHTITSKLVEQNTDQFLRVTRYAAGMSKGLFHVNTPSEKKFCGTFYYSEPESTTVLRFKNALYASDKYFAMVKLGLDDDPKYDNYDHMVEFPVDNSTFMLTPKEYIDWLLDEGRIDEEEVPIIENLQNRKFYAAAFPEHSRHYALQDKYDQPLCDAARTQGYDVIVLTHMVGSHQIVTEVLDTRSRAESFQNLYFIND